MESDKIYIFNDIKYTIQENLRIGYFKRVYKAIGENNEIVAIKMIKLNIEFEGIPVSALREITVLKNIEHHALVKLLHLELSDKSINIWFEYIKHDLKTFWELNYREKNPDLKDIKYIIFQIIQGVDYLHRNKILHRGLEPRNILINDKDLKIKIADFGFSRTYTIPIKKYTKEILPLWYRAPELMLGAEFYSIGIDIWTIGCIMAELFYLKPIFRGDSEFNQLSKIFNILGNPNENTLPGYKTFPLYSDTFPIFENPIGLAGLLKNTNIDFDGLDILSKLLSYNPCERISCKDALKHSFFAELQKQ